MAYLIEISCISWHQIMQAIISIKSPPKYLQASFKALENLFSISISTPYFIERLQEFESLTFNFKFKRERILKAKSHLLGGLMRLEEKVSDPKLIIEFISLVENLVAFAETHYIAIKEFSRVMHQQLNEKEVIVIEAKKINEQLQILNKLQLQNRQMLLKLPLHQLKKEEFDELQESEQLVESLQDHLNVISEKEELNSKIQNNEVQSNNTDENSIKVIETQKQNAGQEEEQIIPIQVEQQQIAFPNPIIEQKIEEKQKSLISTVKVSQKIAVQQSQIQEIVSTSS